MRHWHEACASADRGFRTVRRCWRLCGCTGKTKYHSLSRALDMSGIGKTTFYKKLKEFSA